MVKRSVVAIKMLRETRLGWSEEDISRWMNPLQSSTVEPKRPDPECQKCAETVPDVAHQEVPQSPKEEVEARQNLGKTPYPHPVKRSAEDFKKTDQEYQKCAGSMPDVAHQEAPATPSELVEVRQNLGKLPESHLVELSSTELLEHCQKPSHDPLQGWTLSLDALESLLLQCPLHCISSDHAELKIIGDTNLAAAILLRLPMDYRVRVIVHTHDIELHGRLDILLRAPLSNTELVEELHRHVHLLSPGTTSPSTKDLANFLGVTEAAIRQARTRASRGKT